MTETTNLLQTDSSEKREEHWMNSALWPTFEEIIGFVL